MSIPTVRLGRLLLLLFLLTVPTGCGERRCSVHGRVTYEDGSPLTEGQIVGETEGELRSMAQGSVNRDGTFSWGTYAPGDGAKPGVYRVIVLPRAIGEREASRGVQPAVDSKFTNPKTSGIDFEVKAGSNELNITVSRPKAKAQPKP